MSFAARALRARAANDNTRAQINNFPKKSHVIPLLFWNHRNWTFLKFSTSQILINYYSQKRWIVLRILWIPFFYLLYVLILKQWILCATNLNYFLVALCVYFKVGNDWLQVSNQNTRKTLLVCHVLIIIWNIGSHTLLTPCQLRVVFFLPFSPWNKTQQNVTKSTVQYMKHFIYHFKMYFSYYYWNHSQSV